MSCLSHSRFQREHETAAVCASASRKASASPRHESRSPSALAQTDCVILTSQHMPVTNARHRTNRGSARDASLRRHTAPQSRATPSIPLVSRSTSVQRQGLQERFVVDRRELSTMSIAVAGIVVVVDNIVNTVGPVQSVVHIPKEIRAGSHGFLPSSWT
jgi:hypothetical protein